MSTKFGLVLSGGGAKGAYEVGVVKALADLNIPIEVISGASIGAVNGAILSSADSFKDGALLLEEIWSKINFRSVIDSYFGHNISDVFDFFFRPDSEIISKLVLNPNFIHFFSLLSCGVKILQGYLEAGNFEALFKEYFKKNKVNMEFHLIDSGFLKKIFLEGIPFSNLKNEKSAEFYVSVFPAQGNSVISEYLPKLVPSVLKYFCSTVESEFVRLNNLDENDAINYVLASAAYPLLFESVKISGRRYFDGGMGNRLEAQGNTPAQPLLQSACSHGIVVILDRDDPWNRYDWHDFTAIELRPRFSHDFLGLIDFTPEKIRKLIESGYSETRETFRNIATLVSGFQNFRISSSNLDKVLKDTLASGGKSDISDYDQILKKFS